MAVDVVTGKLETLNIGCALSANKCTTLAFVASSPEAVAYAVASTEWVRAKAAKANNKIVWVILDVDTSATQAVLEKRGVFDAARDVVVCSRGGGTGGADVVAKELGDSPARRVVYVAAQSAHAQTKGTWFLSPGGDVYDAKAIEEINELTEWADATNASSVAPSTTPVQNYPPDFAFKRFDAVVSVTGVTAFATLVARMESIPFVHEGVAKPVDTRSCCAILSTHTPSFSVTTTCGTMRGHLASMTRQFTMAKPIGRPSATEGDVGAALAALQSAARVPLPSLSAVVGPLCHVRRGASSERRLARALVLGALSRESYLMLVPPVYVDEYLEMSAYEPIFAATPEPFVASTLILPSANELMFSRDNDDGTEHDASVAIFRLPASGEPLRLATMAASSPPDAAHRMQTSTSPPSGGGEGGRGGEVVFYFQASGMDVLGGLRVKFEDKALVLA